MENNYSITFSSPYQFLFCNETYKEADLNEETEKFLKEGEKISIFAPPIHIEIVNESIPFMLNQRHDREEEMTKCIKKWSQSFTRRKSYLKTHQTVAENHQL